jgi:hypothetical protein
MSNDVAWRRRLRPILAVAGGLVVFVAIFVLLVIASPTGSRAPESELYVFFLAMIALPLIVGRWIWRGCPGLAEWRWRSLLAIGRLDFWRRAASKTYAGLALSRPRLLSSPFRRMELALLIAALNFVLAPKHVRWPGIFFGWLGYAFADPLISSRQRGWWLNFILSLVGFLVLALTAGFISEVDDLGEASMIFVMPLMVYPFALGASAIIRLLWGLPGEE